MPDDIYDYHEHHGAHHNCTHSHDDHPRHHHDNLGSIQYLLDDPAVLNDLVDAVNQHRANHPPALIGESGFDITHRTR